jgi:hypothetical protein
VTDGAAGLVGELEVTEVTCGVKVFEPRATTGALGGGGQENLGSGVQNFLFRGLQVAQGWAAEGRAGQAGAGWATEGWATEGWATELGDGGLGGAGSTLSLTGPKVKRA